MSQVVARTEVEQICAGFARNANAKNVDALVKEFYANDARLLPPGRPLIRGVDGIHAFWKGMIDAGAFLSTLPIIAAFIVLRKQFLSGLTAGAFKGA